MKKKEGFIRLFGCKDQVTTYKPYFKPYIN